MGFVPVPWSRSGVFLRSRVREELRAPYRHAMAAQLVWLRKEFLDQYIGQSIFNLWATEANRRTGIRDAPGEHRKINDQIEKIRSGRSP